MGAGISACVITFNEQENIRDCLESLKWADEIVVVDSGSTDRTLQIAKEFTDRVIYHQWEGMNAQREYTLSQAGNDWVLCLDADERVTPELRQEIERRLETEAGVIDGYRLRRRTYYLGQWIRHGGWYPDWKLRLFRKSKARYVGEDPHDLPQVDGAVSDLEGHIDHYTYVDMSNHLRAIDSFSRTVAENRFREGKRFRLITLLVRPPWKWVEMYIVKLGFLDGLPGFIIAVFSAFYVFLRYAKLWELERTRNRKGRD
jgi:glycosyltransferase involved in cell wall biosynthesis